jgi:hypothetical protein
MPSLYSDSESPFCAFALISSTASAVTLLKKLVIVSSVSGIDR